MYYLYTIKITQKLTTMKANTKISLTSNYEKATSIWYQILTPMQRIEIVKMFDFKSTTKTFRACINHIANNIEQYS
jgi:hypothetical protein